jgi:hypothetical protein
MTPEKKTKKNCEETISLSAMFLFGILLLYCAYEYVTGNWEVSGFGRKYSVKITGISYHHFIEKYNCTSDVEEWPPSECEVIINRKNFELFDGQCRIETDQSYEQTCQYSYKNISQVTITESPGETVKSYKARYPVSKTYNCTGDVDTTQKCLQQHVDNFKEYPIFCYIGPDYTGGCEKFDFRPTYAAGFCLALFLAGIGFFIIGIPVVILYENQGSEHIKIQ